MRNDPKFTQICTYIAIRSQKFPWTRDDWFSGVLVKYMHPGSITPFGTEQKVTVVPQNNDTTTFFPPHIIPK
jgi:hypothetical protein